MSKITSSRIFGEVELLELGNDDEEIGNLKTIIEKFPVNTFGILNKLLNKKNLRLRIMLNDNLENFT